MARYDASTAEVLVFTFKEGLLSAVAHDLKLKVARFTVDRDGDSVKAELHADSLQVVTPMKDGAENPGAVPRMVYGEIEKNAAGELEVKKHPLITFTSTSLTETEVVGRLTVRGVTRDVRGRRTGNSAEFQLDQRDFGMKPFSAMLGTLKVKPNVVVKVTLPA